MEKSGFHFVVFLLFWITKAATVWAQIVSRRHWWSIKADFHSRRSRSRKGVSDPAKIESRSPQRSTELNRIGPGESKQFYFLAIPLKTPMLMNQRKQDCRRRMQKRKRQPIVMPVFRPSKGLWLRQSSFHWILGDGIVSSTDIFLPILLVWFLLDRIALRFWLWHWLRRKWKASLTKQTLRRMESMTA